jgi:hypothetical protein
MRSVETPQEIAHKRTVSAEAVLTGRVDLRAYPHRHLTVLATGYNVPAMLTEVMASAEHLSQWGWELVNVANVGNNVGFLCAVMRRTG